MSAKVYVLLFRLYLIYKVDWTLEKIFLNLTMNQTYSCHLMFVFGFVLPTYDLRGFNES